MPTSKLIILSRPVCAVSRHAFAVLAAACVFATADVARAGDAPTAYPLVCAQHDLRVITLIDLHGHALLVAADVLAEAYVEVVKARDACAQGRVAEGVAIYERLLPGLDEIEGDEIHAAR